MSLYAHPNPPQKGNFSKTKANLKLDEFYFSIPKNPIVQNCPQCKAFSPIPSKKISIEICNLGVL